MVLGSEGRLGIVTAATVHVHRAAGRARDPRLPVPDLGRLARRDARHRRERGVAVGDARVRRRRDAVLVRDEEGLVGRRAAAVERADDVPAAAARVRPRRDVPRRSSATRAASGTSASSAGGSGRIVARHGGLCIGSGPGELYDQKKFDTPYIRDFLLDRGVLADVSETAAPWSALPAALRRRDGARPRRVRRPRRARLRHVPPVALLPLRRVPVLHVRVHAVRPARRRSTSTTSSSRRSSRRSWTRAPRSRTTTPSARSTRAGSSRTSRRRASRWCARCSTASTRAQPQPGEDRRGCPTPARGRRWGGASRWSIATGRRRDGERGAAPAPEPEPPRSPSRRHGRERARARPESALRPADVVGRGRARGGAARGTAAVDALAGGRRLAGGKLRARRRARRSGAGLRVRDPRLASAPASARRVLPTAARCRASSRRAARSRSTATASAPSGRARSR